MKKVILLFIIIFSAAINAKTLTKSEKQEVLRQFSIFQEALETKDGKTLKGMIDFPLELTDSGRDYEEAVKESEFMESLNEVTEELGSISHMKVNIESGSVSEYLKKGYACNIKYTGSFRENMLYITETFVPGESASCGGHAIYKFKMYENKLKLFDVERKY